MSTIPSQTRLHLGCGRVFLPHSDGWKNHDLFSSVNADVYADMCSLPFDRNTFDLVYAGHVAEHCHRHQILATFAHWKDILKPGGILRLAVPDFEACVEWYNRTKDLKSLLGLMFGGQNFPRNSHTIIFDRKTLSEALYKVGFENVREWDYRTTDHAEFDDYSQAWLPHLAKDQPGSIHMSLNLEASKPL